MSCIQQQQATWSSQGCQILQNKNINGYYCYCEKQNPTTIIDDLNQLLSNKNLQTAFSSQGLENISNFSDFYKFAIFWFLSSLTAIQFGLYFYGSFLDKKYQGGIKFYKAESRVAPIEEKKEQEDQQERHSDNIFTQQDTPQLQPIDPFQITQQQQQFKFTNGNKSKKVYKQIYSQKFAQFSEFQFQKNQQKQIENKLDSPNHKISYDTENIKENFSIKNQEHAIQTEKQQDQNILKGQIHYKQQQSKNNLSDKRNNQLTFSKFEQNKHTNRETAMKLNSSLSNEHIFQLEDNTQKNFHKDEQNSIENQSNKEKSIIKPDENKKQPENKNEQEDNEIVENKPNHNDYDVNYDCLLQTKGQYTYQQIGMYGFHALPNIVTDCGDPFYTIGKNFSRSGKIELDLQTAKQQIKDITISYQFIYYSDVTKIQGLSISLQNGLNTQTLPFSINAYNRVSSTCNYYTFNLTQTFADVSSFLTYYSSFAIYFNCYTIENSNYQSVSYCPLKCSSCDSNQNCLTCISQSYSIALNPNTNLYYCKLNCEDQFYATLPDQLTQSQTCKLCVQNCQTCTNGQDCQVCYQGFEFVPQALKCLPKCNTNQYRDSSYQCQNCVANCLECTGAVFAQQQDTFQTRMDRDQSQNPSLDFQYDQVQNTCNDVKFSVKANNDAQRGFLYLQWSIKVQPLLEPSIQSQVDQIIQTANTQKSQTIIFEKYLLPPDSQLTVEFSYTLKVNWQGTQKFTTNYVKAKQIVISTIQSQYPPIYRFYSLSIFYSFYVQSCDQKGLSIFMEPLNISLQSQLMPSLNQNYPSFSDSQIEVDIQPFSISVSTHPTLKISYNQVIQPNITNTNTSASSPLNATVVLQFPNANTSSNSSNMTCIQQQKTAWSTQGCQTLKSININGYYCYCDKQNPTTIIDDLSSVLDNKNLQTAFSSQGIENISNFSDFYKFAIFWFLSFLTVVQFGLYFYGSFLDKKYQGGIKFYKTLSRVTPINDQNNQEQFQRESYSSINQQQSPFQQPLNTLQIPSLQQQDSANEILQKQVSKQIQSKRSVSLYDYALQKDQQQQLKNQKDMNGLKITYASKNSLLLQDNAQKSKQKVNFDNFSKNLDILNEQADKQQQHAIDNQIEKKSIISINIEQIKDSNKETALKLTSNISNEQILENNEDTQKKSTECQQITANEVNQQSTNRNSEEEKKKKNEKEDDDDLTVEKYMSYPLLIRILVFHDFFSTFFLYDKVISRSIRFTIFYIRMIHCLSISTIFSQQYNEVQMIMISILNSIVLQVSLAIIQLTHRIKIIGKWVSTVAMMSLCLFYYYVILSIVSGQNAAASNYRIASFFIMVAVDFAVVAITISTFKMLIVSHMLNKKNPIKIIVKLFNLLNLQEVIQNLSI
ncbi:hypothetical protein ABPG74_019927 [Tetrahymena malaccensis]